MSTEQEEKIISRRLKKPGMVGITLEKTGKVIENIGSTICESFAIIDNLAQSAGYMAKDVKGESQLEYAENHTERYKRLQTLGWSDTAIDKFLGEIA